MAVVYGKGGSKSQPVDSEHAIMIGAVAGNILPSSYRVLDTQESPVCPQHPDTIVSDVRALPRGLF